MSSFIVEFYSRLFSALGKVSFFCFVKWLFARRISVRFVDGWVISHLGLSIVSLFFISQFRANVVSLILVIYGILRVFEIAVYQTNVLLFDEYRAVKAGQDYALDGYRRIVILLLHNYMEIIFWFASTYTYFANDYIHKWGAGAGTAIGGIYSSFITMTTFGDFDLLPKNRLAAAILLFHATVGIFMTLLSLARFISLIPAPKTKDNIELKQSKKK